MIWKLVGVVAAGALLAGSAGCSSLHETAQQPLPNGEFGHQLDAIAAEASSQAEGMRCQSRSFGVTPATAREVSDVQDLYAWSSCAGLIGGGFAGSFVPVSVTRTRQGWVATEPPDDVGPGDAPFDALFPPGCPHLGRRIPQRRLGQAPLARGPAVERSCHRLPGRLGP